MEPKRARSSLASRMPRLRISVSGSELSARSEATTPTTSASGLRVVVRASGEAADGSPSKQHDPVAHKLRSAVSDGHCEHCGKPFSVLRRASVCGQCAQRVCSACLPSVSPPAPPLSPHSRLSPPASPKKLATCDECAKIDAFERQLARSYFSTTLAGHGKRALYPGLSRACYREWFHERCNGVVGRVRAGEKKRTRVIRKLHDRQLLHSPKWCEPCDILRQAFGTAVSYVSLASGPFELIVGSSGDMLHFSCFPREIGMCDQVLGTTAHALVLCDVTAGNEADKVPDTHHPTSYRHNPFLVLAKAGFFAARSIEVGGVGIGIVALLDPSPRAEPMCEDELKRLKIASEVVSERVASIISPRKIAAKSSPSKSTKVAQASCGIGICSTPSIQ